MKLSVRSRIFAITGALAIPLLLLTSFDEDVGKPTEFVEYGWIEPVAVAEEGIVLYAKLDTGADHCSMDASDIRVYEKKGEYRVSFTLRTREGEEYKFDREIQRQAKIKRIEGQTQVRPVVKMYLCLGGEYMSVDVNLVDRSNFAYPLLIGRSFLSGYAMVNPAKSFTSEPQCMIPKDAK